MSAPDNRGQSGDDRITIFHNPRCSKSREAVGIIDTQGAARTVVEYLKDPPGSTVLEAITKQLDVPPIQLVRTDDAAFRALGIDPASLTTPAAIVDLLVDHPEVMQRPLVVRGDRAIIARPPERVLELLVD